MRISIFIMLVSQVVAISSGIARADSDAAAQTVSFYNDIRPIFQARCHGCHQPAKASGAYVMTSAETLRKGGESELPAVVARQPEESYLLEQITPVDGIAAMPQEGEPLDQRQITLIRTWIEQGAIDDTPADAVVVYDTDHPPEYSRPPVITSLDFSPDGQLLAVAGFHELLLHDLAEMSALTTPPDESTDEAVEPPSIRRPSARLIGMSERIESVRFSPDGKRLAVTGGLPARMGEVQIWNVASRELELSVPVTFDTVYGASWSPDGKLLAFACADNTVRAIDSQTGEEVLYQGAHSDWVFDTVFSVDGSHLASVGRDQTAKLIEVATQRFVDNITSITPGALSGGIHAVARHPERDEILFGGADGTPKVYRMHRTTKREIGDDANLLWELPPLPGRVFSVDYSQSGEVIAAGSSLDGKGAVHLYGIDANPNIPKEISDLLVKPTHARSAEERKKLAQHFAEGVRTLAKLSFDDGIYAVAIDPKSQQVAAAGANGRVRLIDAETGAVVADFVPVEVQTKEPAEAESATRLMAEYRDGSVDDLTVEDEPLPKDHRIIRLTIYPDTIPLRSRTDYVQVVVLAELESGDVIDVTRRAKWTSTHQSVQLSNTGIVTATGDAAATLTATLADQSITATVDAAQIDDPLQPNYVQDVSPLLARVGCNAGTCHGAQDGKNGFKLSLRGYDPLFDVRALTDDLKSRRVNLAAAAESLMLLKSTAQVPHEGGQVVDREGDYYRTLRAWIESGAELETSSPGVASVEIQPTNPTVPSLGGLQQMRVVATYEDGSRRDVTREAFIESGNTEVAQNVEGQSGLIQAVRRGEAPVLVRYEGAYAATTITVMGDRSGFAWQAPPANNRIDELVHTKLERTKTAPAPLCDDYTFVRRVYVDLTGLPPTPEQIREFLASPHDSRWKREQLIDSLVGSPDYVEYWSNKWADLLQVNSKFLRREGAEAFRNWIREEIRANTPYDQFARKVLMASGSTKENPAAAYFKILRDPDATMENTTHLFLATRFNCNKCHDHPFERWTQDQYYQLSAFFARVGLKKDPASGEEKVGGTAVDAAKPLYEIVFTKSAGEMTHLRTGKVAEPEFPFQCDYECPEDATRREQLATWITSPDNPYFATSYVNRIWAYLTGRGLIDPIDDIRAGNPPTNPELLNWLTQQFLESGFDTQHVIRTICRSRTYQLALATNRYNEDDELNYSHARARRLPAEVLFDAITLTTGAPSQFPGVPPGTRAAALPDVGIELPDGFLNNLGRPARESACECERTNELQMGSVMALINGATVADAISHPENAIARLVAEEADDRSLLKQLYLRILSRPARTHEIDEALAIISQVDEEHQSTVARLREYEAEAIPLVKKKEQERAEALAAKRKELERYLKEIEPERLRLEQERKARFDDAKQALQVTRASLLEKLPDWEEEHRGQTVWESLNPIELTSTFMAALRVVDDGSVLVEGLNGYQGANIVTVPTNLTGITGVRIDVLADDRLPNRGPGRSDDGNFVLSELKVESAPQFTEPRPLVKAWDFTDDTAGWSGEDKTKLTADEGRLTLESESGEHYLAVPITAPAAPLALEITAKIDAAANLRLLWTTVDQPDLDDSRAVARSVTPGVATWRTYRLYFEPGAELAKLKLEINGAGKNTLVDAMRLVQASPLAFTAVELQNAQADISQNDYPVASAIDGQEDGDDNGWAVAPQTGSDHVAVFETADSYAGEGEGLLRLQFIHNFSTGKHNLGRFRVSITRSERPIGFGIPEEIAVILATDEKERTPEQQETLADYYLARQETFTEHQINVAKAEEPVPPDTHQRELEGQVARLENPLPVDPRLTQLRRAVELSEKQLAQRRLTVAQDVAWALINSPEFLYNH